MADEERRKLSSQVSDDSQQQQQPPSFKSLIKQQKQQKMGMNDLLNQQPTPTSRSYQGSTPFQQQMQLPKQNQNVYDKRSESTHVDRNLKDNMTDV